MSLNGLDAVKVNQAHEAAIAETGGWFLLKYITRDEVDIHKTGTGGSAEVREAIGQYEDKSPLYGLLLYRRKRVLLKYVPDGTSRLLQARLAVHLQSVIEKFPHDALVSIQSAADLTDAALSSSVSALKTSGSIRSMDSVKRRRLTEIAEDASEVPIPDTPQDTPATEENDPIETDTLDVPAQDDNASTSTTKAVHNLDEQDLDLPRPSIDLYQEESRPSLALSERSIGFQTLHNAYTSNSDSYAYLYKSKVKLAPRPVAESRHSSPYIRPTSTLPAGVLLRSREVAAMPLPPLRPRTAGRIPNDSPPFGSPYTPSFSPPLTPSVNDYRPDSRGSAITLPANIRSVTDDITPEKRRLMKALQKRREQQKARQLAKEGRFEDGEDQSKGEALPNGKSISDKRNNKKSATNPNSQVEPTLINDAPVVQTDSSPIGDSEADLVKELEGQKDTNHGPAALPDEPLLEPTSIDEEPGTNSKLSSQGPRAGANTTLPPAQSILQFPNWSENSDSVRRALPPSPPASDIHETTQLDVDSAANATLADKKGHEAKADVQMGFQENSADPVKNDEVPLNVADNDPVDSSDSTLIPEDALPQTDSGASSSTLQISNNLHKNVQNDDEPRIDTGKEEAAGRQTLAIAQKSESHADDVSKASAVVVENAKKNEESAAHPHNLDTTDAAEALDLVKASNSHEDTADDSATTMAVADDIDDIDNDIETPTRDAQAEEAQELLISSSSASIDRRSRPPPIQPPNRSSARLSTSHSRTTSYSEEDSLLDELEDAAVEEAKTVTLAKTPTTPFTPSFPRQVETRRSSQGSHKTPTSVAEIVPPTPAIPNRMDSLSPPPSQMSQPSPGFQSRAVSPEASASISRTSPRNISPASFATPIPAGGLVTRSRQSSLSPSGYDLERPSSRRSVVSSLISQRMKAFEDKNASSSPLQQAPNSAIRAQIVTLRKVSLNTPSPSSSTATPPSVYATDSTPRFGQRFGFGRAKKDEVVSKKETPIPSKAKTTDAAAKLNEGVQSNLSSGIREDVAQPEAKTKKSFFASRKKKNASISSMSSEKSARNSTSDPVDRSRSPSSVESLGDSDKKEKRKSGILKRLSNMGSSHRSIAETIATPLHEEPTAEVQETKPVKKQQESIVLGDLNVQFPDTLLWKRKYVEIDQQGFLVLSPSLSETNKKIATKRYHLSDFRNLYIPEPDREELPYSVNLDFQDGSTIQCACESSPAQQRVHQALITARNALNDS